MSDLISRQAILKHIEKIRQEVQMMDGIDIRRASIIMNGMYLCERAVRNQPSAEPEIIRCKDCKHNPKDEWFGCPMSHLSEAQRPETAWCWKAERRR